jgi:hypothetical protein
MNGRPEIVIPLQKIFDLIGEVMNVDDDFLVPESKEAAQRDFQQRVPPNFHERFRAVIG